MSVTRSLIFSVSSVLAASNASSPATRESRLNNPGRMSRAAIRFNEDLNMVKSGEGR
jgi:hypothetical protein